jgi:pilus assembly protein CpaB
MDRPSRPLPSLTGPGRRARWRRVVIRRVLSVLLATAAVVVVLAQLRPSPPPLVEVVVAARDVAAGAVLTPADVRVDTAPESSVQPHGLTRSADAVGRRVGSGLAAGEAVTARRLVPRGVVDGLPAGRVALHVVAADPASVDLLAPGSSVRVYPVGGGPPLARDADVLATDPPTSVAGALAVEAAPPGRGVVLSLSAIEADAVLAGHGSLEGPVTVALVGAPG